MSLNHKTHLRGIERRRKRFIVPIIYFLAELVALFLVLLVIQVEFNIFEWNFWAIFIFILGIIYSIIKTVNVYQRQKSYPTKEECNMVK